MSIQNLSTVWNKIAIEITYNSNTFNAYKEIYGHGMTHLKIQSAGNAPLPISKTGFRSRYTPETIIEDFGGAVGYVRAWLDDATQSKEWKAYVKASKLPKQLTLF